MATKCIVSACDRTIYTLSNIVTIHPYDYSIDVETVIPRQHNSCGYKSLAKGSKEYINEIHSYIVAFLGDDTTLLDLSKFKVH